MAAALPQLALQQNRRFGLHITGGAVLQAPVIEQRVPHRHALGVEKGHARRLVMKAEQIQGRAQTAMVALAGLLQKLQIVVELFFVEKSSAVNPLQLCLALIRAPVGARHLHQLEGLDEAGVGHMRPAAQIGEIALLIERDRAVGQIADHFQLVGLVLI